MLAYLGDAEAHGAMLALKSPLIGGEISRDGIVLHTNEMTLQAGILVNQRRPAGSLRWRRRSRE